MTHDWQCFGSNPMDDNNFSQFLFFPFDWKKSAQPNWNYSASLDCQKNHSNLMSKSVIFFNHVDCFFSSSNCISVQFDWKLISQKLIFFQLSWLKLLPTVHTSMRQFVTEHLRLRLSRLRRISLSTHWNRFLQKWDYCIDNYKHFSTAQRSSLCSIIMAEWGLTLQDVPYESLEIWSSSSLN